MIKKIDDDHYEIVTETTVTLSISELEQEREMLVEKNRESEALELEIAKLPENIRSLVTYPIFFDMEIEEIDKKLNLING